MENTNEQNEQSAVERVGIDYTLKLSFTAVDASDLENKRDVLYSLVCFGCMFDEKYAADPDPIVKKHDCLHEPEPNKLDLYELAYTVASLPAKKATAEELKTCWFMTFAYVLLSGAPHNAEIYDKMCDLLHRKTVFDSVLASRYSVYIPATKEELIAQGAPSILVDWYVPYLGYCAATDDNGVTRETRECKRLLALGRFDDALLRSERLLAAFPDDVQIVLSNVAARVSLSSATDRDSRIALLKDTLSLIDDYIVADDGQYLRYYRGLTLLGLMDTVGARREFELCLQNDPNFELAAFMLKGMDKYEE